MNHIIGILWFKDELKYSRALELFTDSRNMPATFADWKVLIERELEEIKHADNTALLVDFDPEPFIAWCRSRGFQADSQARTGYAEHAVLEYQKTGKGTVIK